MAWCGVGYCEGRGRLSRCGLGGGACDKTERKEGQRSTCVNSDSCTQSAKKPWLTMDEAYRDTCVCVCVCVCGCGHVGGVICESGWWGIRGVTVLSVYAVCEEAVADHGRGVPRDLRVWVRLCTSVCVCVSELGVWVCVAGCGVFVK